MMKSLIFAICLSIFAPAVLAQPMELTADGYLEWQRGQQRFVAKDNVKAIQGDTTITANMMSAVYSEKSGQTGMALKDVTATGNVIVTAKDARASGDKAVYNMNTSYAEMTGATLKLSTPDQTLTAQERFEYWVDEGRLVAKGNVIVTRPKPNGAGEDTLSADQLTAILKTDANGKRIIDTITATGRVIIKTPTETITGSKGTYRASSNTAELTGGVTIKRGPNILQGSRATVDMKTSISKIYGGQASPSGEGRVRAVFYPGQ